MLWLFDAARQLKERGILGMNHRNAACILDHNSRALYPVVDDKLRMRDLCVRIGVATPEIYAEISYHSMLRHLDDYLRGRGDFVVKPNRGSAGRGVLVLVGRSGKNYLRHNGEALRPEQLRQHFSDILSGMYSLGGRPDRALVQQRVRLHPAFEPIAYKGIPDIRVVLYRDRPAMAMLRLPTKASNGRANLHQGGIGAGVDLDTGRTHHAVQLDRMISIHPDTGASLTGMHVPHWPQVLEMAEQVSKEVGLGYVGVDIVIDETHGPMLLEANARPGLAIQIANNRGLLPRLKEIDGAAELEDERDDDRPAVIAKIGPKLRRSA
ncbi:MAG TPA: alpha-L-glutamate ligase-like protein [Gemmataceae bacterium]|nr:alpha-L-glutamate ligase-like protein [Gemmataceae bacterium]